MYVASKPKKKTKFKLSETKQEEMLLLKKTKSTKIYC